MLGAIIGDLAGSIYEFEQVKKVFPVKVDKLIENNAFYSDDTILTIAILDAIINHGEYSDYLKKYALEYNDRLPNFCKKDGCLKGGDEIKNKYFEHMFSPNFAKWARGEGDGKSRGNGAMMRISPVGFMFNSISEVKRQASLATKPSHNSKEALSSAKVIALIIYYARLGLGKEEIIKKLGLKIIKPTIEKFNYTCKDTIDICLFSLFTSDNFEQAITKTLSFGGDTDTNAAIVGGMAEALFGIDEKLKTRTMSFLPKEFIEILQEGYSRVKRIARKS